jgi:hypothetical protein
MQQVWNRYLGSMGTVCQGSINAEAVSYPYIAIQVNELILSGLYTRLY